MSNEIPGDPETTWIPIIQDCFDRWSELTGITFVRVQDGSDSWDDSSIPYDTAPAPTDDVGDIRISAVDYTYSGYKAIAWVPCGTGIDPCTDPDTTLGSGMAGNLVIFTPTFGTSSANNYRGVRNLLMHELGHAIGLRHICAFYRYEEPGLYVPDPDVLMYPTLGSFTLDGPQLDDVRGAQYLYGDPYEENNTAGGATLILSNAEVGMDIEPFEYPDPQPTSMPSEISVLSLHSDADDDWYSIECDDDMLIRVSVVPAGYEYYSRPQSSTCVSNDTTGNPADLIDAKAVIDLEVEIVDPMTTDVLGSAASEDAGETETVELAVASGESLLIHVAATATEVADESQLYKLRIEGIRCPADVNEDDEVDVLDFLDFLDAFAECEDTAGPCMATGGSVDADYDGDSWVDSDDWDAFYSDYSAGCAS